MYGRFGQGGLLSLCLQLVVGLVCLKGYRSEAFVLPPRSQCGHGGDAGGGHSDKETIFRITSSYSFGYTIFIAFMCSSSTCIRPPKGTELAAATKSLCGSAAVEYAAA